MPDIETTPVDTSPDQTPDQAPTEQPKAEPAKKKQMSFSVLDTGVIRAEFGEGIEPLTLNPADVPESILSAAVAEGLISRTRGYTSKLTEKERTAANLRERVAAGFAALLAGTWKVERGDGAPNEISIEAEAAWEFRKTRAESKGEGFAETVEQTAAVFASLTKEQVAQLKATPRYKLSYATVKARRDAAKLAALQKKVETDEADIDF